MHKPRQKQCNPALTGDSAVTPHTYVLREHARAKHVKLKVSLHRGLEITVPRGFDRRNLNTILRRKREWIEEALRKVDIQRAERAALAPGDLPSRIELLAVGRRWYVQYYGIGWPKPSLHEMSSGILAIRAREHSPNQVVHPLLHQWLKRKGRELLLPFLDQVSERTGLRYAKATIRGQRTRWGSCSSQRTISLNYKLLFLPPHLVHYLCLHELCHTKHLNHSGKFWRLVEHYQPNYHNLEKELDEAWKYLPLWVDH